MHMPADHYLAQLKYKLSDRLSELRSEVSDAIGKALHLAAESQPARMSRRDSAHDVADLDRDLAELRQVHAALRRIADGIYGDCVDCGVPIPLKRLMTQPAADRCSECQIDHAQLLLRWRRE